MIHTVKGAGIVNEAEVDVFLELSCLIQYDQVDIYDPVDIGNLISGSSAFSKSNLNVWKFLLMSLANYMQAPNCWTQVGRGKVFLPI